MNESNENYPEPDNELEVKESLKEFRNLESQSVLKKLALSFCDPSGRGFFLVFEVCQMFKAKYGTKPLEIHWREKYAENMNKLTRLGLLVSNLNFYMLHLNPDNVLSESEVSSPVFVRYRKMLGECSFYLDILYSAFSIYLECSRIQYLSIPNHYWSEAKKILGEE